MALATKFTETIAHDLYNNVKMFTVYEYQRHLKETFDVDVSDTTLYEWADKLEKAWGESPFLDARPETITDIAKRVKEEWDSRLRNEDEDEDGNGE